MNKNAWIIIAFALLLVGALMFVGVMAASEWDISNLSTSKYETNEYSMDESYESISIKCSTADVDFVKADDGKSRVVCYEEEKSNHSVNVEDGTLTIEEVSEKKWYDHIGISWGTPKITVYLTEKSYSYLTVKASTGRVTVPDGFTFDGVGVKVTTGSVSCLSDVEGTLRLETSTGKINVEGVSAENVDLTVTTGNVTVSDVKCANDMKIETSTGKTEITDVECKNLESDGSTGDIVLKRVLVQDRINIERDTGDVSFEESDAGEINVETDTGDVKGSLLTRKSFMIETDTGSIDVPKNSAGGKCEITTDTGDIKIRIAK